MKLEISRTFCSQVRSSYGTDKQMDLQSIQTCGHVSHSTEIQQENIHSNNTNIEQYVNITQ